MARSKLPDKRKRITLAMRPDIHDRLRRLAEKHNLSMSRMIEMLILERKL